MDYGNADYNNFVARMGSFDEVYDLEEDDTSSDDVGREKTQKLIKSNAYVNDLVLETDKGKLIVAAYLDQLK